LLVPSDGHLRRDYPFAPEAVTKRQYGPVESTRVFVRDGFIDRYTGERLIFPPVLRVLSAILPAEFPYHPNWKTTVTQETEILRRIRHRKIIRLLDHGTTSGFGSWLVLEYASGGSLADAAVQQRLRAADELTRLLLDCSGALLHAHLEGVVHRDLKPSNILFDAERSESPTSMSANCSGVRGHSTRSGTSSRSAMRRRSNALAK
jgi:serine/threonine protein kinase